ncbi:hypothetical protein G6027_05555 [Dietzia sp. SLG310A2-38A2]|uniref:hypothetical protein n=1 Tax=Dietzia sp. SLG310A2-38A2 TaxID=1630643 RepID=UPI0015FC1BBE|nr:hypothetical protein [Dietzia sp. SLG310A2-38A2]MBB1030359.1 hypothetical protein [Dietzia sp. SLG310A2-38A2]
MTDLEQLDVADLLRLWAGSTTELKRRGVIQTRNMVGEIAEAVAHAYLGGVRGSFSQAGWDIRTDVGERVQVKGIWRTTDRTRRNTSVIRDQNYDTVLIVEFDHFFEHARGYVVSREVVEELFSVTAHVNGRIIKLTARFLNDDRVKKIDLTACLESL